MLPFTEAQFFDLFERYNLATWPAPLVAYGLALAALFAILAAAAWRTKAALLVLAALWAWTGVAYHLAAFTEINPAGWMFGLLFAAQAVLFGAYAFGGRLEIARVPVQPIAWLMIAYAMVLYPLLNALLGHAYPRAPAFGVTPCPLVIFTFGVLLLSPARTPWLLMAAPLLWAVIGGSAAVLLGVAADWALPVSGVAAALLNLRKPGAAH